ncbi:MAG: MunI family type II restriction endonuclease [Chitinophagaceae bacterium]|nr:MunI family type II restriction endonuclease [Chitinophagaceae bacterium]
MKGTEYRIPSKPNEFNKIYVDVELTMQEEQEIYMPLNAVTKHGVSPDYAIDNTETNKTIYVEVKRQDGWVEGRKGQQDGVMLMKGLINSLHRVYKKYFAKKVI